MLILNLTSCHIYLNCVSLHLNYTMEKIIEESKQGESLVLENKPRKH
jgi:hypothetical protein